MKPQLLYNFHKDLSLDPILNWIELHHIPLITTISLGMSFHLFLDLPSKFQFMLSHLKLCLIQSTNIEHNNIKTNGSHLVVFNLIKLRIASKHNKLLSINDYKL